MIDLPSLIDTELACLRSKVASAPGPDSIPARLLRYFAPNLSRLLGPLYFKAASVAQEPMLFKESIQAELIKVKLAYLETKFKELECKLVES